MNSHVPFKYRPAINRWRAATTERALYTQLTQQNAMLRQRLLAQQDAWEARMAQQQQDFERGLTARLGKLISDASAVIQALKKVGLKHINKGAGLTMADLRACFRVPEKTPLSRAVNGD